MRWRDAAACAAVACMGSIAHAQTPDVQVRAVPEFVAVRPGGTFRVAVQLQLPQGWHIGWINPGAGGLATTIAWQTPNDVEVRETAWPYPETDDEGGEISHVYRGTIVLFSTFNAAQKVRGSLTLAAELVWGLCRTQCVQQHRTVNLTLPVVSGPPRRSREWGEVALAERSLPIHVPTGDVRVVVFGDSTTITLTGLSNGPPPNSWLTFFPLEPGRRSVVGRVHGAGGGVALMLPASVLSGSPPDRLAGVLVGAHAAGAPPVLRPLAVDGTVIR